MDAMIAGRALIGMFLVFAISQRLLGGEHIYPIADKAVVDTATQIFLNGLLISARLGRSEATPKTRRRPGTLPRSPRRVRSAR